MVIVGKPTAKAKPTDTGKIYDQPERQKTSGAVLQKEDKAPEGYNQDVYNKSGKLIKEEDYTTPEEMAIENAKKKDTTARSDNYPTATFTDVETGQPSGFDYKGNTYFGPPKLINEAVQRGMLKEQANAPALQQIEQARQETSLKTLRERQLLENEQLRADYLEEQPERLTGTSALARAGGVPSFILADKLRKLAGKPQLTEEQKTQIATTKGVRFPLSVLGGIIGTDIPFLEKSFSDLFNLGTAVSNMEGDITLKRTATRDILTAVRDGADPIEALRAITTIEESIESDQWALLNEISNSPEHLKEGKTINEFIYRNLATVNSRKGILERYIITGDYSEIDRAITEGYDEE